LLPHDQKPILNFYHCRQIFTQISIHSGNSHAKAFPVFRIH